MIYRRGRKKQRRVIPESNGLRFSTLYLLYDLTQVAPDDSRLGRHKDFWVNEGNPYENMVVSDWINKEFGFTYPLLIDIPDESFESLRKNQGILITGRDQKPYLLVRVKTSRALSEEEIEKRTDALCSCCSCVGSSLCESCFLSFDSPPPIFEED